MSINAAARCRPAAGQRLVYRMGAEAARAQADRVRQLPRGCEALLMLAGGVAGVAGWASTFGFDVVKTRMQATERASAGPYTLTLSTIVHSYRADSLKVFFVGLWPTVVRAVPVNMVTFAAFELAVKMLTSLQLPV